MSNPSPPVFPESIFLTERRAGGGWPTGMVSDTWESKSGCFGDVEYVKREALTAINAELDAEKTISDGLRGRIEGLDRLAGDWHAELISVKEERDRLKAELARAMKSAIEFTAQQHVQEVEEFREVEHILDSSGAPGSFDDYSAAMPTEKARWIVKTLAEVTKERDCLREDLSSLQDSFEEMSASAHKSWDERDSAIVERDQLREEVKRLAERVGDKDFVMGVIKLDSAERVQERDAAIAERDRLRAEHDRRQKSHAELLDQRNAAIARADKAEKEVREADAELAGCGGRDYQFTIAEQIRFMNSAVTANHERWERSNTAWNEERTARQKAERERDAAAKQAVELMELANHERDTLEKRVKELVEVNKSFFPEINDLKHRLGVETALREQAWSVIKRIGRKSGWVEHQNDAPWQERIIDRVKEAIEERDALRAQIDGALSPEGVERAHTAYWQATPIDVHYGNVRWQITAAITAAIQGATK